MKNKILVQDTNIKINQYNKKDYLSLTDRAKHKDSKRSDYIIQNWMRSKDTIEFLGLWERINNTNFNSIEFDGIKNNTGVNSFILTPKQWKEEKQKLEPKERLERLNEIAIEQLEILLNYSNKKLENKKL